jgi:hypothetical protein
VVRPGEDNRVDRGGAGAAEHGGGFAEGAGRGADVVDQEDGSAGDGVGRGERAADVRPSPLVRQPHLRRRVADAG